MKKTGLLAIALGALALAGCAGGYYDRNGYYHDHYATPGRADYGDRYQDRYYADRPARDYRDRDYRHDRYDDN
jgi:hypothetical protein